MRTTINIDDDLVRVLRAIADSTRRPIGKIASELIRKGLQDRDRVSYRNELPLFEVGESPSIITGETVERDQDGF